MPTITTVPWSEVPQRSEAATLHPTTGGVGMCPFHNAMKTGDAEGLRKVAAETMRDHVFGDDSYPKAEKVLLGALGADPQDAKGATNHLLGLCYFHMQRWGDAIKHLEVAAQRDPSNVDAAKVLERARTAAGTGMERPLGPTTPLDGMELKKPPALFIREPEGLKPEEDGPRAGRFATLIRKITGHVGGAATEAATSVAGMLRDKDKLFAYEDWDRRPDLVGKLMLADIRNDLNEKRLHSTYEPGTLVGHQPPGQKKPEWTDRYRTATGAWTTSDPMEGAAGTEFSRTGSPVSERKSRALDSSLPSPREVSRVILAAKGERKEAPFLNSLAIAWIQFQTHDWVNHRPPQASDGAYKVPLADDDPLKKRYGMDNMYIPKSAPNPLPQEGKLTYLNEVTHWWDASQIYGSDQATQDRLRMGADGKVLDDGKMRIEGEQLPVNPATGVDDTGFSRNWWVGLDLFHTLFVKNHNSIADTLKKAHPDWSTDQLFHTARLVNSAVLAKIHTVEWTPAVLPNKKLAGGMAANWWGLAEAMSKPFEERRIDNGWEPNHPVLGGLVGGKRDSHGKPYALSEEFVEVYRLHAGMMDHIAVKKVGEKDPSKLVPAEETRGTGSNALMEKEGMATLLNSFGNQNMNALVHNNYPEFMSDMSVDGQSVVDIGAVDILRARERGVPQYNEFREMLGLNPIKEFKDLGCDEATCNELERLYGKGKEGVDKLDLLAGTLCELNRPKNYGFGETLFTVFIQMASRRLQADPFYTEKLNEKYYTKEGMEIIEKSTLKDILVQHFPELAASGLGGVKNAFEPWDTTVETHPEEHPLSAGAEKYRGDK